MSQSNKSSLNWNERKTLKMNSAIEKAKRKVEQAYHTEQGQRAW